MITNKILSFPDDFKEISQGEYKTLKKIDPQKVNGYTARIRFKYFKIKQKDFKLNFEISRKDGNITLIINNPEEELICLNKTEEDILEIINNTIKNYDKSKK